MADPLTIAALAGAGLKAGTGIIGAIRGQKGERQALEERARLLEQMQTPTEADYRYTLQALQNMGNLTPDMMADILIDDTELQKVNIDPRFRQNQLEALARLERRAREGLTLEDRAAIEELAQRQQAASAADQQTIMQNMAARGTLGSGQELAMRLAASQQAAEDAANRQRELARLVAARQLEAGVRAGTYAGELSAEDYKRQSERLSAQDLINRLNVGHRLDVQKSNVDAINEARKYNLDYLKELERNRVDTLNRQAEIDRNARIAAIEARNQNIAQRMDLAQRRGTFKDTQFANRMGAISAVGDAVVGGATTWRDWKKSSGSSPSNDSSPNFEQAFQSLNPRKRNSIRIG